jgi:hypothetical protein
VDCDGARLLLNESACACNRPHYDIATDTEKDSDRVNFAGRLAQAPPGRQPSSSWLGLQKIQHLDDFGNVRKSRATLHHHDDTRRFEDLLACGARLEAPLNVEIDARRAPNRQADAQSDQFLLPH